MTEIYRPHPEDVRYEFTTIPDAIEWVQERGGGEGFYLFYDGLSIARHLDPDYDLLGEAVQLLNQSLIQRISDFFIIDCRGFEVDKKYPRILISDCALFVLPTLNAESLAEGWRHISIYRTNMDEDTVKTFAEGCIEVLSFEFERIAPYRKIFSQAGFNLRKALSDRKLKELYERINKVTSDTPSEPKDDRVIIPRGAKQAGFDIALVLEWCNQQGALQSKAEMNPAQFIKAAYPDGYNNDLCTYYRSAYPRFYQETDGLFKHCLEPGTKIRQYAAKLVTDALKLNTSKDEFFQSNLHVQLPAALQNLLKDY